MVESMKEVQGGQAYLDGAGVEEEVDDLLLSGRLRLVQERNAILQRMPQRPVAHLGQVWRQILLAQLHNRTGAPQQQTTLSTDPNLPSQERVMASTRPLQPHLPVFNEESCMGVPDTACARGYHQQRCAVLWESTWRRWVGQGACLQELLGLAVGGSIGEEVEGGEAGLTARGHKQDGRLALARMRRHRRVGRPRHGLHARLQAGNVK